MNIIKPESILDFLASDFFRELSAIEQVEANLMARFLISRYRMGLKIYQDQHRLVSSLDVEFKNKFGYYTI